MSSQFHNIFETAFEGVSRNVDESVLDFPKGKSLSRDVWRKEGDKYVLTTKAKEKIQKIVEWIEEKFGFKNMKVRIVGSICSNTFNDKSDIDIHVSADDITEDNAEKLNRTLIYAFKRKFSGKTDGEIGKHPLEVYAQHNVNQDIMSVGCYDFDNNKWLSGPEILDEDFNPYEEYYDGIQKHLDDISDEIRRHVFVCGELASVLQKISGNVTKDDKFMKRLSVELDEATKKARSLFEDVRKKRSVASAPKSAKEAKKNRTSKEWKIADSSFKYLDKLGYIATLLAIAKVGEDEKLSTDAKANKIISEIHDNLFNRDRTGYADINKD